MTKLPSIEQVKEWIEAHPEASSRRDIAKAFGLKSEDKAALKELLKQLNPSDEPRYQPATIMSINEDGDAIAQIMGGKSVTILALDPSISVRDEVLLRIEGEHGRFVRKIDRDVPRFMARFDDSREGGRLVTISKGRDEIYLISDKSHKLKTGDLVLAEAIASKKLKHRFGDRYAKIVAIIGNVKDRHILSQISIEEYELPHIFSETVLKEAREVIPADVPREDFTKLPFVTIDPHDARDHDDAVYVEPWGEGHRLYVAIADVAAFVRPDTALDIEAYLRGNSVYFPDRVVPMLPDHLSGDLCSLHENVVRPVIFVAMDIDKQGRKLEHRFGRANISSFASLTYEQAQDIEDDLPVEVSDAIKAQVKMLFTSYRAMAMATEKRGALHLDLPERKIELGLDGTIKSIGQRERLDAHKLVEEAMVMANVAAAQALESRQKGLLYRIHETPKPEKLEVLRQIAKIAGYKMNRSEGVSTAAINVLLDHASKQENGEAISMQVLRALRQARYSPENFGHYGLALKRYAHFTSPIRRYADLVVHRALISAYKLGPDGANVEPEILDEIGNHISQTERMAMQAERDTNDRYVAQYLAQHLNSEVEGRISGLSKFGLFVTLDETHADGFVPLRLIGGDHYVLDRAKDLIRGIRNGRVFKMGDKVLVKIFETNMLSGGIELLLLTHNGEPIAASSIRDHKPGRKPKGKSRRRKG